MADAPIRVVIADDSETVRRWLRACLTADAGFEIVGEAVNGKAAVDHVIAQRPNIVVMDVEMPEMDGIDATRQIMSKAPTPIVMFTSSTIARQRKIAFEALAAGALDVYHKPDPRADQGEAEKFRKLLTLLAPIKVITRTAPRQRTHSGVRRPLPGLATVPRTMAVAASTGGPVALVKFLSALPPTFPACVLLVQHQPAEFMQGFVEWLGDNIALPVKLARHGDALRPAVVFVAPGDQHMRLGPDGRIHLDHGDPIHACRPAADALFTSVARISGAKAIGVLLTGMGQDGARGLLDMKRAGAVTIAQDEGTSVVYGMPKAAVDLGGASQVLPLEAIAEYVQALLAVKGKA